MINLNTNLSSLITQRSLATSTQRLNQAIEQMTTGFKINHAKDNAANYNITTNMTTKIGAYMVAEDNCAMGLDLLATANGSLEQIADKLQRLRALAVQTSNGTSNSSAIGYVQEAVKAEATALVEEIERLYNTTEYNGISVMKGRVSSVEESKFIKDIDRRDTSKMTTLASIDPDKALTSGTYSISTPEELAKLATMVNKGLINASTEFVLAADIDLSCYSNWVPIGTTDVHHAFQGSFDGNGYVVKNMKVNASSAYIGLFGYLTSGIIKNLGVEDASVESINYTGLLCGYITGFSVVDNCYSTGCISGNGRVGGLCGSVQGHETFVYNSYSEADVNADSNYAGGLIGYAGARLKYMENCYAIGDVTGKNYVGGLVGFSLSNISKSWATGAVTATLGSNVGEVCGLDKGVLIASEVGSIKNDGLINLRNTSLNLQVGVDSNYSSQISSKLGCNLNGLNSLRNLRFADADYISQIDLILKEVSSRQVDLGATENRLESALDEISIQYENLVSSRSTLRDADISEVSSEYIRQQILQQASATLMATANQSPSIALQLI